MTAQNPENSRCGDASAHRPAFFLPSSMVPSWHPGPSGGEPALKAAGRDALLTLERDIRFPLLLISAANHVIFGFGSLLETGAQCK